METLSAQNFVLTERDFRKISKLVYEHCGINLHVGKKELIRARLAKRLRIGNRINWMKICAMVWHLNGRKINNFRFDNDDKKTGLDLDRRLQALDESQLNRYLAQIDAGVSPDSFADISPVNQQLSAFGQSFSLAGANTLEIDLR